MVTLFNTIFVKVLLYLFALIFLFRVLVFLVYGLAFFGKMLLEAFSIYRIIEELRKLLPILLTHSDKKKHHVATLQFLFQKHSKMDWFELVTAFLLAIYIVYCTVFTRLINLIDLIGTTL